MYLLTVLEARSLKLVLAEFVSSEFCEVAYTAFLSPTSQYLLATSGIPWLIDALAQSLTSYANGILSMCMSFYMSNFLLLIRTQSYWFQPPLPHHDFILTHLKRPCFQISPHIHGHWELGLQYLQEGPKSTLKMGNVQKCLKASAQIFLVHISFNPLKPSYSEKEKSFIDLKMQYDIKCTDLGGPF